MNESMSKDTQFLQDRPLREHGWEQGVSLTASASLPARQETQAQNRAVT